MAVVVIKVVGVVVVAILVAVSVVAPGFVAAVEDADNVAVLEEVVANVDVPSLA